MTLAFVAAVLCLMLALAGTSLGGTSAFVAAQPSPSGSASQPPQGEPGKIFLLNPNATVDPHLALTEPPRDPSDPTNPTGDPDPPKISDEFDGVDTAYHIVAAVKDPPPTALVEAYYAADGENEVTVGELSPVAGSDDTYELFWDIDENTIAAGFGTLAVRLFEQTPTGFEEVSADEVPVRIQHETSLNLFEPQIPEAETVELTWPSQNGPLGFYKGAGAGAAWQTVINGTVSQGDPGTQNQGPRLTYNVRPYYSVTPIGRKAEFKACNTAGINTSAGPSGTRTFMGTCTLQENDRPSQVTALAVLALQDQDPDRPQQNTRQPTAEGSDAHRVQPYLQRVEDMKISLTSSTASDSGFRRHALLLPSWDEGCIGYEVAVKDALDRPVQGANVDIHLRGPGDSIQFATNSDTSLVTSAKQKPQKAHSTEAGRDCEDDFNIDTQGDHNVPGADDVKHIESASGTGLDGGTGATFGEWMFNMWSSRAGDTEITAWIDDEPIATESDKRAPDDDLPEETEKTAANFAQWFNTAHAVTIDPLGATAAAGDCQSFIIRVRAGSRAVRGANVDVHAQGPSNDLDFCDPGDGSQLNAPQQGTGHNAEDEREVAHAGEPPVAQHTEGQTNEQGNLVVGITSPVPGDTTLTAWYDAGEAPFDNDVQDAGEPSASAATNWLVSTGDATISFLNPSAYAGAGTNVANTRDVDDAYHLVARVSSLLPVGVEFLYRSGSDPLVKIADATRIGHTDTHEAYWRVDVPDGEYTLVGRIAGTNITVEQSITVQNENDQIDPTITEFETVEITSPLDATQVAFVNGTIPVRGVASAGAEGVIVYYTKAGPLSTPASGAWTECGTAALATGSAPQEFTIDCSLAGGDQPALVTGIAAITYNCFEGACDVDQTNHSGDAHRVIGTEANPLLSVEPAETAGRVDSCQKFVVTLQDQTRQPIPGQNLDVHLVGPSGGGNFCAPEDTTGTPRRAPNEGGHLSDGDETDEGYHDEGGSIVRHTEAESTANGRFIFGIESATAGDTQVIVWLDSNDNDVHDQGETTDTSVMHWQEDSVCDVTGTSGSDELEGSDASETICGFGGNDTIRGGGGDDVISGGAGNDRLRGNGGSDTVGGGAGSDRVFGGGGGDDLSGGGGRDVVKGHTANDRLRGNKGNDTLAGGSGRDNCGGGAGRDRLRSCERGSRSFALRTRPI